MRSDSFVLGKQSKSKIFSSLRVDYFHILFWNFSSFLSQLAAHIFCGLICENSAHDVSRLEVSLIAKFSQQKNIKIKTFCNFREIAYRPAPSVRPESERTNRRREQFIVIIISAFEAIRNNFCWIIYLVCERKEKLRENFHQLSAAFLLPTQAGIDQPNRRRDIVPTFFCCVVVKNSLPNLIRFFC